VNPDSDNAVVRVDGFQWRFSQQDEVGRFARLNGPNLRIDFERSGIVDSGSSENLFKSQSGLFELLHFEIAV
jgi:hypothetical protein